MENKETSYEFNTDLSSLEGYFLYDGYNVMSSESIKKWLKNHVQYNKQLRDTSRFLYGSNGMYTNVIDYMVALPTLDRVVYSTNKNHSRFKKNKEKFNLALKKMKDKVVTRDILHKSATEGVAFYYFETTDNGFNQKYLSDIEVKQMTEINADFKCSVVPLPTDYCQIVGMKNSSYVIAFDCSYFDQFTSKGRSLKIKRYPKEIRTAYRNYKKDLNKRWAVLDNDNTIAIKVRAKIEEKWGRPIGLAAFIDMLYDEYFVDTKRNVLDEVNSTVVYQTFPEGEKKGTSSLTQKQQKQQHENIKQALFTKGMRKGVNFFSVASGTKLDKLVTNIDFLKVKGEDELIKRISTNLGFAGSALNGQDGNFSAQKSNIEMVSSEIFGWLEQVVSEYNKVINANVIKDRQVYVEMYYLPITHVNRKDTVQYMRDLYTQGKGSLQAWIASTGFNPEAYLALMDEELEEGFDEKYLPHATSYTMSGDNEGKKDIDNDSENENTQKNKSTGSNPV